MDNDTDLTSTVIDMPMSDMEEESNTDFHTVIELPLEDLEEESVDSSSLFEENIKTVKTLGAVTALTQCVLVHIIILCVICVGLYNLTLSTSKTELWVALVSAEISSLCPSPSQFTAKQWLTPSRPA